MHTRASHPHAPPSWQLHAQTAEMAQVGLDSSLLHLFLSEPDLDHPNALPPTGGVYFIPPTGGVYFDPHSDEYFDKLVKALELDGPLCAEVDPNTMDQFKEILHKYPEAFHLPGTPLGKSKDFTIILTLVIHHQCITFHTGKAPLNCVPSKMSCNVCCLSTLFSQVIFLMGLPAF